MYHNSAMNFTHTRDECLWDESGSVTRMRSTRCRALEDDFVAEDADVNDLERNCFYLRCKLGDTINRSNNKSLACSLLACQTCLLRKV